MQYRSSVERLFYQEHEEAIERCLRRLVEDLEIEPETAEMIMNLRSQVMDLQRRLWELEVELDHSQARKGIRLSQFREVIYEGSWTELGNED